jgi:hypothetical protein
MIVEGCGNGARKWVEQQLVVVEVMAACWVVGAVGTQAIVLTFSNTFNKTIEYCTVLLAQLVMPNVFAAFIEQAKVYAGSRERMDGDVCAAITKWPWNC